jgi:hypothetical protein
VKDVPFAGAKMSLFEGISRAYLYACSSYGINRTNKHLDTKNGDKIKLTGAAALSYVESGFVGFMSGMSGLISISLSLIHF